MIIETENYLDKKLSARIKKIGGWSIKLVTAHITGLPDRLCLLPGGRLFFAEIKTTKKKPKKIQNSIHKKLRGLGFDVYVVDSSAIINTIFESYD